MAEQRGLESPSVYGQRGWNELFLARGQEVSLARPIITGDVFTEIPVPFDSADKTMTCAVMQHPCSLRRDGITLVERALVAEIVDHKVPHTKSWNGSFSYMPIPRLRDETDSEVVMKDGLEVGTCIYFDEMHVVPMAFLTKEKRIACLSPFGVNLLIQRWVHYMSRTPIPMADINAQMKPVYDEAALCAEWCETVGANDLVDIEKQSELFLTWLRDPSVTPPRSEQLQSEGKTPAVLREMRTFLEARRNG